MIMVLNLPWSWRLTYLDHGTGQKAECLIVWEDDHEGGGKAHQQEDVGDHKVEHA